MAIDTREDRAGTVGTHWIPILPIADALALSQEDRQQVVGVYPGVLAGELAASAGRKWIDLHYFRKKLKWK